jgi:adenosylcobinamide-GDP ribazoletransferase
MKPSTRKSKLNETPISEDGPARNDNARPPKSPHFIDDLIMGLRFFSRLPSGDRPHEKPLLSRIAMALPFTSVVIGIGPAAVLMGAAFLGMPGYFAAGLAVAAMVIVTGAMAEDGLADAADGLFGGATRERRLEILKDSRHGTYGVAALCLFIVLRVVALGSVAPGNVLAAGAMWLAATLLARSGALWLTVALPPARSDGASAAAGRTSGGRFAIGAGFAVLLSFVLAAPVVGIVGLVLALLLAVGVAAGWSAICKNLIGGQTGDLIGALQALIEIAVLTGFMLFL